MTINKTTKWVGVLVALMLFVGCTNSNVVTEVGSSTTTPTPETAQTASTEDNTAAAVDAEISSEPLTRTEFVLNTVSTITLFDHASDAVLQQMFDRLTEIENRMSRTLETSEVYAINEKAGIEPVKVSPDTYFVIEKALEYAAMTDGIFDISLGPVIVLWGIGTDDARLPGDDEIKEALTHVDYAKVELNEADQTVFLKEAGMLIDLGGIAKGYAADEIKRIALENGVVKAMINLGGNVYAYGEKAADTPWKVGVQSPFYERNDYFAVVSVTDKTVVTSGPYERNFEQDGKIYHHIFNSETGYPTDNDVAAVTIVADDSIDADALSTIMFCLGVEAGLEFIKNIEGAQCIYVTADSHVYVSDGLKNNINITDDTFVLTE